MYRIPVRDREMCPAHLQLLQQSIGNQVGHHRHVLLDGMETDRIPAFHVRKDIKTCRSRFSHLKRNPQPSKWSTLPQPRTMTLAHPRTLISPLIRIPGFKIYNLMRIGSPQSTQI